MMAAGAAVTPAVPVYPTTSYPTLPLPDSENGGASQARAAEPPPAVARLQGIIQEVQPR